MEQFLTPEQAADLLQVSVSTIYRMIKRGDIRTFPGEGYTRIYPEQFKMPEAPAKKETRRDRIWGRDLN